MLSWGKTARSVLPDPNAGREGTPMWARNIYHAHEDVLGAFVFRPMLSVHTPLEVLERNGETFDGPPEEAPRLARDEHGVWVPQLSVWNRLGVPRPVTDPEPVPSVEAGPVMHDTYLAFLRDFRRCIEGPGVSTEQLARLRALPARDLAYRSYWEKLRATIPGFPESVFERDILRIDGIGWRLARRLVERGLNLAKRVAAATDSELLSVPGLGRRVLRSIRRHETFRRY